MCQPRKCKQRGGCGACISFISSSYMRVWMRCMQREARDKMFRVANSNLFHALTVSIKLSVFSPPSASLAGPLRAITEVQSGIAKSIWRRLAWMHLQAAVMTADSFLRLLLVQSHGNPFSFFSFFPPWSCEQKEQYYSLESVQLL